MRRHIHALMTLANDVYCSICGWWYPPHSH